MILARTGPATHSDGRQMRSRNRSSRVNVGDVERLLSVLGGFGLALFGLQRRSVAGLGLGVAGASLLARGVTGHCAGYQALGISTAEHTENPVVSIPAHYGVKVEQTFTINRPREELYRMWSKLEELPRFMSHLESVRVTGPGQSHWTARTPVGPLSWDAQLINSKENELIAWRSLEGSAVDTAGSVHFLLAPGGRGTEVKVVLKYDPPAGKAGAALARLFGEAPEQQIREDLRRFKQLAEAGEAPMTKGQPTCRC